MEDKYLTQIKKILGNYWKISQNKENNWEYEFFNKSNNFKKRIYFNELGGVNFYYSILENKKEIFRISIEQKKFDFIKFVELISTEKFINPLEKEIFFKEIKNKFKFVWNENYENWDKNYILKFDPIEIMININNKLKNIEGKIWEQAMNIFYIYSKKNNFDYKEFVELIKEQEK